jgi:putative transposase
MVSPHAKREAVTVLMTERGFGVTRACGLVRISRSLYRYRSCRPKCTRLRARIEEIAALKRRYGYRRIHVLLRREGWRVNRKLTYRLYRESGLAVRRRKRKRIGPFRQLSSTSAMRPLQRSSRHTRTGYLNHLSTSSPPSAAR